MPWQAKITLMRSDSTRWLVAIGVTVAVLVMLTLVIAVVTPSGGAAELPADSPEGVVQRYVDAAQEQDYPLAHSYYSTRLQETCTIDEITGQARWVAEGANSRRIELVETRTISDGRTQVRVRIVEVNVSPPFGVNEYSHDEWYVLVQESGGWRLDSLGWPVTYCRDFNEPVPRR